MKKRFTFYDVNWNPLPYLAESYEVAKDDLLKMLYLVGRHGDSVGVIYG